jgi:hypothetical protein
MFPHTLKTSDPMRSAWQWVALLALLGLPLACDRTPTAPVTTAQPRIETSLLFPPVTLGSPFDASQYFDINVDAAAQQQYCPTWPSVRCTNVTATQVSGHLYGWRAVVNGIQYSIDMQRAVANQFGSGYFLGAVGAGIYDWRAVHWSAIPSNEVLPVMPIASDYFFNVSAVQTGLANLESMLLTVQAWYAKAMTTYGGPSKTFHLLQPLVAFVQRPFCPPQPYPTAAQWNSFYYDTPDATQNATCSDGVFDGIYAYYQQDLPQTASVVLAPFAPSTQLTFGAGWNQEYSRFVVESPGESNLSCSWGTGGSGLSNNIACQEATYFVAWSLAFTFGLRQSLDGSTSLMDGQFPPQATLTVSQINTLTNSGFFN